VSFDIVTIKYSSAGAILWLDRYDGPGNAYDAPNGIKVDGSGNVFVTGGSSKVGGGSDFVTIKYAPSVP
jgi:hypothetical protein